MLNSYMRNLMRKIELCLYGNNFNVLEFLHWPLMENITLILKLKPKKRDLVKV